jgi:peptidoglycan/LPS O-acetylase OafA/YrhL
MRKIGKQVRWRTRGVAAANVGLVAAVLAGAVTDIGITGLALDKALYPAATIACLLGVALFAIAAALRVRKFAQFRSLSALYLFSLGLLILIGPIVALGIRSWWPACWALTAAGVILVVVSRVLERPSRR